MRRLFVLGLTICALVLGVTFAPHTPVRAQDLACGIDLQAALEFMTKLQNDDGGFSDGFSPESKLGATADAVVAFAAAGEDVTKLAKGSNTPLTFLADQVKVGKADTVGALGKVLAAALTVESGLPGLPTKDLAAKVSDALTKDIDKSGFYGQAQAILALATSGVKVPQAAIDRLLASRDTKTGGFSFDGKSEPDTNTTALAIMSLVTNGDRASVGTSYEYLRSIQNADKGWPYQNPSQYGTDSDSNSTALVLYAIISGDEKLDTWGNPQDFLKTFQQKDGSFTFQLKPPSPSFLATVQIIPALCAASEMSLAQPTPAATPKQ